MFVFDAGTTDLTEDGFALPSEEIRSTKFVSPEELSTYLHPVMVGRMLAAIEGADAGVTRYLER